MANRTYKIRRFTNGQSRDGVKFSNYSLTIPAAIAEKLPKDMLFECELTDDGILFRPVQEAAEEPQLPAWAQEEAEEPAPAEGNGKTRSRPRQRAAA